MPLRGKLPSLLAAAGAAAAMLAFAPAPASADSCTLLVTVQGGQTYTYRDVAPGTPLTSLNPPLPGKVISQTQTCSSNSGTTTATTTTDTSTSTSPTSTSTSPTSTSTSPTSTSTSPTITSTTPAPTSTSTTSSSTTSTTSTSSSGSTSTTTTSTSSSSAPKPAKPARQQKPSTHQQPSAKTKPVKSKATNPHKKAKHNPKQHKPKHHKPKHHKPKPKPTAKPKRPRHTGLPSGKGVPAPSNPTFSLSTPGPAPIGVPNFFIDSFRIPPFLIPIYQAAGIEYQVPWQILAAINEIETDYGRNLSVSSAGAVGWMQFLPSTWQRWAVDANGDGVADPYNAVDAIFTAARYLHAAGASTNLSQAIFAYNHADWYVQSVLLRAKLIGGIPSQLIGALTGLVQGHFPIAAPAKYADDSVVRLAKQRAQGANAAVAIDSNPASTGTSIFAKKGSPVIAVNDGKILKVGDNAQLGHYIVLQDATGNVYTYSQLGLISRRYPVPKPVKLTAKDVASELAAPAGRPPTAPASAGSQLAKPGAPPAPATTTAAAKPGKAPASSASSSGSTGTVTTPLVKERLFAHPARAASYAAGGDLQLKNSGQAISSFQNYFADTLHLGRKQYTLKPLRAGAIVVAGTILGRIGGPSQHVAPHLYFQVRPAGKNAPLIDPKPILDGWKLLEATAVYRAAGVDPFFGRGAKNASVGQVLLMSKQQLTDRVLTDPHVQIYNCGRRDIEAGLIDRRVLATIEFLSASGLDPYVSGLDCGHSVSAATGVDEQGTTGASVDISKINNVPVLGHQGPGSITDITIRRLLTLQGSMAPDQIISGMSYRGQSTTVAMPDHKNRIQITYTPEFGTNKKLAAQVKSLLQPGQWVQLINHISQIPEPVVPIAPSKYAIRVRGG